MARGHGFSARNGENQPLGEFTQTGKFGRLFPRLPAFTPSVGKLDTTGLVATLKFFRSVTHPTSKHAL